MMGEKMMAIQPETSNQKPETSIDVSRIAKGIYWLELVAGDKIYRTKFVKQ